MPTVGITHPHFFPLSPIWVCQSLPLEQHKSGCNKTVLFTILTAGTSDLDIYIFSISELLSLGLESKIVLESWRTNSSPIATLLPRRPNYQKEGRERFCGLLFIPVLRETAAFSEDGYWRGGSALYEYDIFSAVVYFFSFSFFEI